VFAIITITIIIIIIIILTTTIIVIFVIIIIIINKAMAYSILLISIIQDMKNGETQ
jgi:hypothetical protein